MDEKFNALYVLDNFESLIWTERFNGAGNFEFYTIIDSFVLEIVDVIQKKLEKGLDVYAWLKGTDSYMIVEDLEILTDVETGKHLLISGRGLESILERRIIWNQTTIDGVLQDEIIQLIKDAIINPTITDRKISNFDYYKNLNEELGKMTIKAQYTGDNLYDVVFSICQNFDIGFDVTVNSFNDFEFSLNVGEDRSYEQTKNHYVVFSPKFENVLSSDYLESIKTLKNVNLVAGEGQGASRKTKTVGSAKGLSRREMYTDANDIQSGNLSSSKYDSLLENRGKEKLSENKYTKVFTGEMDTTVMFVYGKDFFKGDIVQFSNEYGMETRVRVTEFIRSQDSNGYQSYPTFQIVSKKEVI